ATQNQTANGHAALFRHAKLKFATHGRSDLVCRIAPFTADSVSGIVALKRTRRLAGRDDQSNPSSEEDMQFNHCRLEFDGPVATLVL
ncbi:hypothetical protein, partial [Enterococcus faecium]|uniref:hypothetical protein n=1 Tax=Enterococcus faecium TaxID=1352 RepID=UPI003F51E458